MNKIKLIPVLALMATAACDRGAFDPTNDAGEGIVFRPQIRASRGAAIETLADLDYIQVTAYRHNGPWAALSPADPATLYMDRIRVEQQNGRWSYAPVRNWPQTGNVSLFAYYPQPSAENGVQLTFSEQGGLPQLKYTVPTVVERQPDIVVAVNPMFDLNRSNTPGGLSLNLTHALTSVGFRASGGGERIEAITVSGVVGEATLALGQEVAWQIEPDAPTLTFAAGVNGQILDPVASSILNEDGLLLMIPQTLTDQAQLTITIKDGDRVYDKTFALNVAGFGTWSPGQMVEYTFDISSSGSVILNPSSLTLTDKRGAESLFAIVCPEQNPDQGWSVTVPEGTWLELADSPSGVNTDPSQTDPYTYTGQGSKLLYAVAGSDNTSGAERRSIVQLVGSSQQVMVTQLSADEPYIPAPYDGWATSNIYWVVDPTKPEGGYLTFSDKGDRSKEQYQGVYFMWGSLVALSPQGNTWTGQILYIPNPNAATNGGWNTAIKDWTYIPRLGWSNPSNPEGGGSSLLLSGTTNQNYLYQNHNPAGNVGDICKYITDKGWAPGAAQGRKWRMPTIQELNLLEPTTMTRKGVFTSAYSTDANGQQRYGSGFERLSEATPGYFPTSGFRLDTNGTVDTYTQYRPGEAFVYWASSPTTSWDNQSSCLYYWLGNPNPTQAQGFRRTYGASVRCVEEGT